MRSRIVATAFATALLSFLLSLGVDRPMWQIALSTAAFSYVAVTSGDVLLRVLGASWLTVAASWAVGVAATSVMMLLIVALSGWSTTTAFLIWAVVTLILDFATRNKPLREAVPVLPDQIGFFFCCAFTAAWCKEVASAPLLLELYGYLPAWVEYFMHAGAISQLGDERAIGRGSIWMADAPLYFYHYASYMVASAFAAPLDLPGLPLATSALLPIGFLSAATAAYALGTCMAGPTGGLAAVVAVFIIPDASNYALRNGFFSFHWIMVAIPGSAYGLANALLAVVFLQRWSLDRSRQSLVASAIFAGATLFTRMQVFALLVPAWLASVAFISRVYSTHRQVLLGVCLLVAAILGGLAWYLPALPVSVTWAFDGGRALERFLYQVHQQQEPTAYAGLYAQMLSSLGDSLGFTLGALLVYPVCLGAFLIAFPLVYLLQRRSNVMVSVVFPVALLVWYGAIIALAPIPAHTDATEFPHRSFMLLYAVLAIWTLSGSIRLLSGNDFREKTLWRALVVICAVSLPIIWTFAGQLTNPKFKWGQVWVSPTVQRDLPAAAAFLRERSKPGDVFASPVRQFGITSLDAHTIVIALSGVPTYLARPGVHRMLGGSYKDLAFKRLVALSHVDNAPDAKAAMSVLRQLGIRWYLVTAQADPGWDPSRAKAKWTHGTAALYDSSSVEP